MILYWFASCGGDSEKLKSILTGDVSKIETETESEDSKFRVGQYSSYMEACRAGDFAAAHLFLDHYKELMRDNDAEYSVRENAQKKYEEAEDDIFQQEIVYVMSSGAENRQKKVIYLLGLIGFDGKDVADGYYYEYETPRISIPNAYNYEARSFNAKCDMILDLAILENDKDLADKILKFYKRTLQIEAGGSNNKDPKLKYSSHYKVTHNDDAKNIALKKYKEAFK